MWQKNIATKAQRHKGSPRKPFINTIMPKMYLSNRTRILLLILLFFSRSFLSAQQATEINVVLSKPLAEVQPTMWGVFFEDINFAADGGLYAELVKNRSFEFSLPLMGWKLTRQKGTRYSMSLFVHL